MNNSITYIFRNRLPQYNSIEEIFYSLKEEVSKTNPTKSIELKHSGATPSSLFKNFGNFKKNRDTVYHITGDVHYMALKTGGNTVLTIHDVKSAYAGGFLKRLYIKVFWFWIPALIVKKITVISEFTKSELENLIPFAKHKICVVHNPVKSELKPKPYIFNEENPHILLIGTKPNKNLERTFKALETIKCYLTIVGKLSSSQLNLLSEYNINFDNKIHLSFDEIIKCYETCDLLCFASTYEGFGMPIIEAQAVGRPVVTSNIGALLEVSQDSTCLVDPYDVNSIREGIKKLFGDSNYREKIIAQGFENVKRFQIKQIANKYIEVYNEVLS